MIDRIASKLFAIATVGTGLLAIGFPGAAQYRYADSSYDSQRYGDRGNRGSLFDRVQHHLDRSASNPYLSSGTRHRVDKARREVWDFQRRWNEGRFDKGQLDDAIGSVQHVVDSDSLDYRDRRVLQDDLMRMREFRSSRGYSGGYRGYDGGYGYR